MNVLSGQNGLLAAAMAEAHTLVEGWDGVMLSFERGEKFRAFGCRWRVMLDLILGTDDGLPNARVLFRQDSVPGDPAEAKAASAFAADVTKRFRDRGYDIADMRDDYDDGPKRVDWRGDKELKTLEDVRAEGKWLAGLKLAP